MSTQVSATAGSSTTTTTTATTTTASPTTAATSSGAATAVGESAGAGAGVGVGAAVGTGAGVGAGTANIGVGVGSGVGSGVGVGVGGTDNRAGSFTYPEIPRTSFTSELNIFNNANLSKASGLGKKKSSTASRKKKLVSPSGKFEISPLSDENEMAIIDDDEEEEEEEDQDQEDYKHSHSLSKAHHHDHLNDIHQHNTVLSTQSPEGIAAASQITPNRLANILLNNGPLPIRHITKHLSSQIPDFALLSLSKQRRLIMSALEMGDEETGCVFEKVGWGQWSAKKADKADIDFRNKRARSKSTGPEETSVSPSNRTTSFMKNAARRVSITNPLTDPHNVKVPFNPSFNSSHIPRSLHQAIASSSSSEDEKDADGHEEENDLEDDDDDDLEDDDEVFKFENDDSTQMPKFSSRVVIPPPSGLSGRSVTPRRGSMNNSNNGNNNNSNNNSNNSNSNNNGNNNNYNGGIRKPRQQRSRLNSLDYIEATLDGNSIQGGLDASVLPDNLVIRRKPRSSFSESYLRSTPTPSLRVSSNENVSSMKFEDNDNDTDEENWKSIGAAKLSAAYTLMDLRSI